MCLPFFEESLLLLGFRSLEGVAHQLETSIHNRHGGTLPSGHATAAGFMKGGIVGWLWRWRGLVHAPKP